MVLLHMHQLHSIHHTCCCPYLLLLIFLLCRLDCCSTFRPLVGCTGPAGDYLQPQGKLHLAKTPIQHSYTSRPSSKQLVAAIDHRARCPKGLAVESTEATRGHTSPVGCCCSGRARQSQHQAAGAATAAGLLLVSHPTVAALGSKLIMICNRVAAASGGVEYTGATA